MEDVIYKALGQYDGYYTHPPLHDRKHYVGERLIKLNNDGHEVWFGTANEWFCFYSHSEFTKFVLWYIWQRTFIDWFGLRSKIWFWLLHRRVNRMKAGKE